MFKSILIKTKDNTHDERLFDLQEFSFFARRDIKEMINVLYDNVLKNIKNVDGEHISFHNHDKIEEMHLVKYQYFGGVILCLVNKSTNPPLLKSLFKKILNKDAKVNDIATLNLFYEEEDKITRINGKLDETKNILATSIDKLLENGQKIEDLLDKSAYLSDLSKTYYKKTKKLNKCCVIL